MKHVTRLKYNEQSLHCSLKGYFSFVLQVGKSGNQETKRLHQGHTAGRERGQTLKAALKLKLVSYPSTMRLRNRGLRYTDCFGLFCFCFSETYLAQTGLKVATASCFSLLRAGIVDMCQDAWCHVCFWTNFVAMSKLFPHWGRMVCLLTDLVMRVH